MTRAEELATDTGATAAVAGPFWLPSVHDLNADVAVAIQWLGAMWLIIQIVRWGLFPLTLWLYTKLQTRKVKTK